MSGEELLRSRKVLKQAYKDLGIGRYNAVGGWAWFRCNLILLHGFPLTDDPAQNAKVRSDVKHLVKIAADNGWGEYRTPPVFMDDVMAAYSFNNHALLRFHETIKDALDPNGIIAPGRSGIWPRNLRGRSYT
jgi:4-cresol dehydrogenase (hydroxylating)